MASYKEGDNVEYRPIGGSGENVAHSTGTIESSTRYTIKNANTGKSTTYQEMNIVKKI
ncbi:uncharacterized protein C8Q71DRAFT_750868 [Rhodofomes roseus]|uniref:Hypervirulence associated protein TUDOR domain-containing protein n=1 Tax=Rhodofomes roseus TaxID=34475 RepID=A0ABQ8KJR1_9APHY|nr:uncharacterized protein C8Q71DRAFT_750868 [Rhodofomes roseus]KAH9838388.1 hypothetical protein C8Q71DRAFT_750868 [Rhodofomes roseus]